jgi:hypothetical protein
MGTAVLTLVLLTVLASLASWLFGQWLARRTRISGAALAVGGAGTTLLIGSVAFVMIAASTGWRYLIPFQGSLEAWLIPAAVVAEWPQTDCVASMRSEESQRWVLDNGCGRVVAVLFASCELSESACFTNAVVSEGWSYEPTGILMTGANDRPVPLRLGKSGPLVAPIFTIRDAVGAPRRIRYLACEVTAPGVLQELSTSAGDEERLAAELRGDACYSQVLAWSRSGQRHGSSPDALLRQGID